MRVNNAELELPAAPQAVALYLVELAGKRKVSTVRRRLVAIAQQHKLHGHASPTADPIVREIFKDIEHTHGIALSPALGSGIAADTRARRRTAPPTARIRRSRTYRVID